MFESRIANVIAYGGCALLLCIPTADFLMGLVLPETPLATPTIIAEQPVTAAAAVREAAPVPTVVEHPTAPALPAPATSPSEPRLPAPQEAYSLREGGHIPMTREQVEGFTIEERGVPAATTETPIVAEKPAKIAPVPMPLSMRPEPGAGATVATAPVREALPIDNESVVMGEPARPLGTMTSASPEPIQQHAAPSADLGTNRQVTAADLEGWTEGSLEEFLRNRNASKANAPRNRFVPPANIGY